MTKAELCAAVLRRLGVLGAGESADANDIDTVGDIYDSEYAQLRKLGLAPYDSNSIDSWAERPLVKYIAAECGPEFGHMDLGANEATKEYALRDMRRQMSREQRYIPTKVRYF